MKKIYLLIGVTFSMLTVGCSGSKTDDPKGPTVSENSIEVTATIANEGLVWLEGTNVSVNGKEFSIGEAGTAETVFTVKGVKAPLSLLAPEKAYANGDIITVPDTQAYVADGYDANAMLLAGYVEAVDAAEVDENGDLVDSTKETASIEVRALCGIIALPVAYAEGEVSIASASLTANKDGEYLAGAWKYDFVSNSMSVHKAYSTVEVVAEEAITVGAEPSVINFVVPAGTYADGLTIEVVDAENHRYVVETTEAVLVEAAQTTTLAQVDYVVVEKQDVTLKVTIAEPSVKWTEGDQIVVNGSLSDAVPAEAVGTGEASIFVPNVAYPYTVLYPQDLYTSSGRLRFYSDQKLLANTYDRSALCMVGYAMGEEVVLHNLCGLIKLPIINNRADDVVNVSKVVIRSNDENCSLAGRYVINYRNATMTLVQPANEIVLSTETKADWVAIQPEGRVDLYAVVPEGVLKAGITVDIYTDIEDVLGNVCNPAGGLTITRGEEVGLEAVEFTDIIIKQISTVEEFEKCLAAMNKGAKYVKNFLNDDGEIELANDIDFEGKTIRPVTGECPFVINGKGFALKNLGHVAAGDDPDAEDVFNEVLFANMTDQGAVKDLVIENCFLNGLVGECNAPVTNVTIKNSTIKSLIGTSYDEVSNITTDAVTLKGGLVSSNYGTIHDVIIDSKTNVQIKTVTDALNLGMVCDQNCETVQDCVVNGNWIEEVAAFPAVSCNFGGVVGASSGIVTRCEFKGELNVYCKAPAKSTFHTYGGVLGLMDGEAGVVGISECVNNGTVQMTYKTAVYVSTGGVVGGTASVKGASKNLGVIENCTNNGNVGVRYIDGGSGSYPSVGGVAGYVEGVMRGCKNYGDILCKCDSDANTWTNAHIAGVAGNCTCGASDCHNYGNITFDALHAGGTDGNRGSGNVSQMCLAGVIGGAGPYTVNKNVIFENCTNNHDLYFAPSSITGTPNDFFGGVFGGLTGSAVNCVNNSDLRVVCNVQTQNVGGITGALDGNLTDCTNNGNITLECPTDAIISAKWMVRYGGIAGWSAKTQNVTISGCTNKGNMVLTGGKKSTSGSLIGGIYGESKKTTTISNVVNEGTITVPSDATLTLSVGNIAGVDNDYE